MVLQSEVMITQFPQYGATTIQFVLSDPKLSVRIQKTYRILGMWGSF